MSLLFVPNYGVTAVIRGLFRKIEYAAAALCVFCISGPMYFDVAPLCLAFLGRACQLGGSVVSWGVCHVFILML